MNSWDQAYDLAGERRARLLRSAPGMIDAAAGWLACGGELAVDRARYRAALEPLIAQAVEGIVQPLTEHPQFLEIAHEAWQRLGRAMELSEVLRRELKPPRAPPERLLPALVRLAEDLSRHYGAGPCSG
jgi:hypothetical protein